LHAKHRVWLFLCSRVDLLIVAGEANTVWGKVSAVESWRRRTQRYFAYSFFPQGYMRCDSTFSQNRRRGTVSCCHEGLSTCVMASIRPVLD
jgi:hypothetical protein